MLYNIRYNLRGTSYKTSRYNYGITAGCGGQDEISECSGYEIIRDLDFRNDSSYVDTSIKPDFTVRSGWYPISSFNSIFEGNHYTIRNLFFHRNVIDNVGLFGSIKQAEIRNVQLENLYIQGNNNVGGLVGYQSSGSITNSYVGGIVKGNINVGLLVGLQRENGSIANSHVSGNVEGIDNSIGGLVGCQGGNISNSFAKISVKGVDASKHSGGLVGLQVGGIISNSYSIGHTNGFNNVGGLVGLQRNGSIVNSNSSGIVKGNINVGLLVGLQRESGSIVNSHVSGNVSGTDSSIGGLVGCHGGSISNSSATINVIGIDISKYLGGLVGLQGGGTISNSQAKGTVIGV